MVTVVTNEKLIDKAVEIIKQHDRKFKTNKKSI